MGCVQRKDKAGEPRSVPVVAAQTQSRGMLHGTEEGQQGSGGSSSRDSPHIIEQCTWFSLSPFHTTCSHIVQLNYADTKWFTQSNIIESTSQLCLPHFHLIKSDTSEQGHVSGSLKMHSPFARTSFTHHQEYELFWRLVEIEVTHTTASPFYSAFGLVCKKFIVVCWNTLKSHFAAGEMISESRPAFGLNSVS